jgi:hypothetical protein
MVRFVTLKYLNTCPFPSQRSKVETVCVYMRERRETCSKACLHSTPRDRPSEPWIVARLKLGCTHSLSWEFLWDSSLLISGFQGEKIVRRLSLSCDSKAK